MKIGYSFSTKDNYININIDVDLANKIVEFIKKQISIELENDNYEEVKNLTYYLEQLTNSINNRKKRG